jgi:predicted kinase
MRKWMTERLKRRKKEPEKASGEKAQAPLQPSFYDTAPPEAPAAAHEPVIHEPKIHEKEASGQAEEASPVQSHGMTSRQPAGDAARPARRRRRGRGGRGRSRGTSEAASPASAALEPEATPAASPGNQADVPAAPPRPSKGVVILAIGLPGSGKSSWFKRNKITPLSTDLLRAMLFDDANEQRFQDLVFSNLRSMLKARLIARRPTNYVDATNLTPHERQGWIKLAKDYGYEVQAVYFDVPLEVCLERNQKRERMVAEDVMRRMAGKLKAPTFEEGFSKMTVVRVKAKEKE